MPGRARITDPQTSHDAAHNAPVASLKARYMIALWRMNTPLTTTEIAKFWDLPRDSFSPRTADLMAKGMVCCVGRRQCANVSGRMVNMNAYDMTKKGRAVLKDFHDRA